MTLSLLAIAYLGGEIKKIDAGYLAALVLWTDVFNN